MNDLHELFIDTIIAMATEGFKGSKWSLDYRGESYFRLLSELGQRPHHIKCDYDLEFASYPEHAGKLRVISSYEDAFFRQTITVKMDIQQPECSTYRLIDPKWDNPSTTVYSVASEVLSHLIALEERVWKQANQRQEPLFNNNKLIGWELTQDYTVCDYE